MVDGRISSSISNAAYWPLRRHHPVVPMGTRVYRRGAGSLGNAASSRGRSLSCDALLPPPWPQNGCTCSTAATSFFINALFSITGSHSDPSVRWRAPACNLWQHVCTQQFQTWATSKKTGSYGRWENLITLKFCSLSLNKKFEIKFENFEIKWNKLSHSANNIELC